MEQKKVVLPSGAIAYIKPELTAGDADDIQDVYFEGMKIKMKKNESTGLMEQEPIEVSPSVITKQKYKLISVATISIEKDGVSTGPVTMEFIRNMSMADVTILENECRNIGSDKVKTAEELVK